MNLVLVVIAVVPAVTAVVTQVVVPIQVHRQIVNQTQVILFLVAHQAAVAVVVLTVVVLPILTKKNLTQLKKRDVNYINNYSHSLKLNR